MTHSPTNAERRPWQLLERAANPRVRFP